MSAVAIVATLNGIVVNIIMASRVMYGLSRQGSLPAALRLRQCRDADAGRSWRSAVSAAIVLAVRAAAPDRRALPILSAQDHAGHVQALQSPCSPRSSSFARPSRRRRSFICAEMGPADGLLWSCVAVHRGRPRHRGVGARLRASQADRDPQPLHTITIRHLLITPPIQAPSFS